MDEDVLAKKIAEIEEESKQYQIQRQSQLMLLMARFGLDVFISETNEKIAYYNGEINALKSLISKENT